MQFFICRWLVSHANTLACDAACTERQSTFFSRRKTIYYSKYLRGKFYTLQSIPYCINIINTFLIILILKKIFCMQVKFLLKRFGSIEKMSPTTMLLFIPEKQIASVSSTSTVLLVWQYRFSHKQVYFVLQDVIILYYEHLFICLRINKQVPAIYVCI